MLTSVYATALTNNFFIKDTYEKEGLTIKYSGVVKFSPSSNSDFNSDIKFNLYLASFFIEEITYQGIKYREHELFGHTFPKEILAKINIKALVNFKKSSTLITSDISSFDKTEFILSPAQVSILRKESNNPNEEFARGLGFRLKLLETNTIEFPINKTVIYDMITDIKQNKALKTKDQSENEYSRLLTEGNLLLNENNFKASLVSYTLAKEYTEDPKYITSKINVVEGYLTNKSTKYRWGNPATKKAVSTTQKKNLNSRIDFDTDFISVANKKKYLDLDAVAKNFLIKNEYDNAIEKYTEAKKYTTNTKVVDQKIAIAGKFKSKASNLDSNLLTNKRKVRRNKKRKLKANDTSIVVLKDDIKTPSNIQNTKIDPDASYPSLLKKGREFLGKKEYVKSKAYFEAARAKTSNKKAIDEILVSVNKLAKIEEASTGQTLKKDNLNQETEIAEHTSFSTSGSRAINTAKVNLLEEKAEILKATFGESEYRKGFIKYKRDEQAVLDASDRVLIPYGKYEILRYRAGFASIKMKDNVALKTIECTGKNDEYSWSARIYQNPWIETVIDKNGAFVDELNKRVEIYVVDNVSLLPWEEIPQSIKDAYKDPNQFTGTDFVSAFKLWEHENANRPDIIARRNEIQLFKDASKNEAYRGANKCKNEVARSIESVYEYYKKLGYEIVVKY